jgi:hypothetical protein
VKVNHFLFWLLIWSAWDLFCVVYFNFAMSGGEFVAASYGEDFLPFCFSFLFWCVWQRYNPIHQVADLRWKVELALSVTAK